MNKKEIISVLREQNILKDIDYGPLVMAVSNGRKKMLVTVRREGNRIQVSTGKIIRHKIQISIDEIEQ
ncbi:MAG: hypothetical protein Q4A63_04255 [Butyricicoccus pullicaecorum]|nr:hypothetical protein [Butyricicoccus pullicaecorum]